MLSTPQHKIVVVKESAQKTFDWPLCRLSIASATKKIAHQWLPNGIFGPPVSPIRQTNTSVVEMSDFTFQKLATPATPSRIAAFSLDDTTFEENSDNSYYSNNSYYSDEGYYSDDVPCSEDCPIQELEYLVPKSYTPTPGDEDSEAD